MIHHRTAGCIVLTILLCGSLQAQDDASMVEYHQPAVIWDTEALPIGNGCMGGMVFGGVESERIQFNHDSLWTGDEQERGAYQPFGDLLICLSDKPVLIPRYSRKPRSYLKDSYEYSMDGDPQTEWTERFDIDGEPVIWEIAFSGARVVRTYRMTSGARGNGQGMPQAWSLQGSNDGRDWAILSDVKSDERIWSRTLQELQFECDNEHAFSRYRIIFKPSQEPTEKDRKNKRHPQQLQIGEISVGDSPVETDPAYGRTPTGPLGKPYSEYRRVLNIAEAVHHVSYESGGVRFLRECFCSYPAQALIVRLSADKDAQYTGAVLLRDAHGAEPTVSGQRISFKGQLENRLSYEAQVHLLADGGTLTPQRDRIIFQGSNSLTFVMSMGTNYVPDISRNWRGKDPHDRVTQQVDHAVAQAYSRLLQDHVSDYQGLFGRVAFHIDGESKNSSIPTDKRLEAYKQGVPDPGLETLLFQMGRYLLISSSRPGGLAANLQGLWNNKWNPTWGSDYHSNINIQMSYWPALTANLHELHMQYIDYISSQIPGYRRRLAEAFQAKEKNQKGAPRWSTLPRGWTMRTNGNLFGATGFRWCETANAWHMQHFWEQYAFTQDKKYLQERAYPAMKEVCQYWEDRLRQCSDGTLVVPDGWSPEHGPEEDGVTYDQMLVWDLFNNFVEASRALDVDPPYREKIADMRDRLLAPQVGRWGQLQEWATDQDDPNDTHRHFSHLIGLHPGRQISLVRTPKLAQAARVTLQAKQRAMSNLKPDFWQLTGWSRAWRMSMWARLHEGRNAHTMLQEVIRYRVYPNMMSTCPPICLDASWGLTAGICEMLLQSHNQVKAGKEQGIEGLGPYELHILPALPNQWAAGRIKGLTARGGFEVSMDWENMQAREVRIRSLAGRVCCVRCRTPLRVVSGIDETQVTRPEEQVIVFPTEAGKDYVLRP